MQIHINLPIVIPAISTGDALHRLSLRYCCVHPTTLVRTKYREKKRRNRAEGPSTTTSVLTNTKARPAVHGCRAYFNRLPKQCYADHCSPIFTKEFCTILKPLQKLSCHVSHVFLYWKEANKWRLVTSPQCYKPNEPTTHCTFWPSSHFHPQQPRKSCTWCQLENQGKRMGDVIR